MRSNCSRTAGFTLIELLVVIAIISVLSAVILASLGTARNKGGDAAVESELKEAQNEAELYSATQSYTYGQHYGAGNTQCPTNGGTMFHGDAKMYSILKQANSDSGGVNDGLGHLTNIYCFVPTDNGTSYFIWAALASGGYFCVDNTGNATAETGAPGAGYTSCSSAGPGS